MSAISEAKLAANRANAQLSTGPKTEAGKAKVSLNAVKTGLSGRTVLLPTDDVAAYEAMIARFTGRWRPANEEERLLVQSLADIDWRMQRIPVLEYGIYAMGEEQFAEEFTSESDPNIRRSRIQTKTFFTHHKKLLSLQSQDARLRRQREQDEARLRELQRQRQAEESKLRQQQQTPPQEPTAEAFAKAQAIADAFMRRDPGPGRVASWMTPAECIVRFRQAEEMEARGEKVYGDD